MNWAQIFQIVIAILIAEVIDLAAGYMFRSARTGRHGNPGTP